MNSAEEKISAFLTQEAEETERIAEEEELRGRIDRLENALKWIRHLATVHYLGGAFNPMHMADLARLSALALIDTEGLPDYEESHLNAERWAREIAAQLGFSTDD